MVPYRRKIFTSPFCQNAVFEFGCHNHSSETGLLISQTVVCGVLSLLVPYVIVDIS